MHLKSSNGAVDVLVCPEGDEQRSHSPCPSIDSENTTSTPLKNLPPPSFSHPPLEPVVDDHGHPPHAHYPPPQEDLNISLSSAVDVVEEGGNIQDLMQNYNPADLDGLDATALLSAPGDIYNFHCLSPTLPAEDFCFGLDGAEGIAELFDLV